MSLVAPAVPARLAINQATVPSWDTGALLEGCAAAGYRGVGLWRQQLADYGAHKAAAHAAQLGLTVSSLCRAGFFLASDERELKARRDDNRRAVEEAAELGAAVLVLVCGPGTDRDLEAARRRVTEEIALLAEVAAGAGVRLGIEPMHPLYCGDRSVIVTLAQALSVLDELGRDDVGVVVDSYHLWWDPDLERALRAAAGRVLSVQLADWLAPPPHPLNGRGMLGEGVIDLARFCELAATTGYAGFVEVEIFNPQVWEQEPAAVLATIAERCAGLL